MDPRERKMARPTSRPSISLLSSLSNSPAIHECITFHSSGPFDPPAPRARLWSLRPFHVVTPTHHHHPSPIHHAEPRTNYPPRSLGLAGPVHRLQHGLRTREEDREEFQDRSKEGSLHDRHTTSGLQCGADRGVSPPALHRRLTVHRPQQVRLLSPSFHPFPPLFRSHIPHRLTHPTHCPSLPPAPANTTKQSLLPIQQGRKQQGRCRFRQLHRSPDPGR